MNELYINPREKINGIWIFMAAIAKMHKKRPHHTDRNNNFLKGDCQKQRYFYKMIIFRGHISAIIMIKKYLS